MSIACTCPEQPVRWKAASAAVANEFDDTGQFAVALARQDQPAFDRLPAKSVECDIEGFLRHETEIHLFKGCAERKCPGLLKRGHPERVEVPGFVAVRAIGLEFVEREIEEGHGDSYLGSRYSIIRESNIELSNIAPISSPTSRGSAHRSRNRSLCGGR